MTIKDKRFPLEEFSFIYKADLQIGDFIKVVNILPNDPDPIPIGDVGIVRNIVTLTSFWNSQIWVDWDSGRRLHLLMGDPFIIYRQNKILEHKGIVLNY